MEFNKFASNIERCFNIAAGIPVVAIVSSYLRATAAAVQISTSFTIGCVGLIAQIVDSDPKWKHMTKGAVHHWVHGQLNGVRVIGEMAVAQTIIGSPLLFFPQLIFNQFRPIVSYTETEKEPKSLQSV